MKLNKNYSYITNLQKAIVDKGLGNYIVEYVNISCGKNNIEELERLCNIIDCEFLMYQYRKDENGEYVCSYKDTWDIFYWGGEGLVKLSFNYKKSVEEKLSDINRLLELLNKYSNDNIDVIIQYGINIIDNELIENKAKKFFETNKKNFITLNGVCGKIKKVQNRYNDSYYGYTCDYGFFKKGSKCKYYQITNAEIATMLV